MAAQGLHRVVVTGKFRLCQAGVDLAVADVVQQHRWPALAAFQLRGQVVQALWHARWDWTLAQGASRVVRHGRRHGKP